MAESDPAHADRDMGTGPASLPWPALRRRLQDAGLLIEVQGKKDADNEEPFAVDGVTDDSRDVTAGDAFVAVRGTEADGHSFIDMAVDNGARLVVCETVPDCAHERFPNTVFARVASPRTALAEAAALLHDDPADDLCLVGVTGTNGKTTVAYLVHHVLDALGTQTGLLSTIDVRTGEQTTNEKMTNKKTTKRALTTPGPLVLHRTLRQMVDAGCTACVMEASSHALDQERTHGLGYEVAIFTNLSADHLGYHGTPGAYKAAKKTLFESLGPDATALYNADDEAGTEMVADTEATAVSFALEQAADIEATVLDSELDGLRLQIDGRERRFRLAGRFNVYNLTAAYGTGTALGFGRDAVLDALAEAPPVPGRFEPLRFDDGTTIIVDYAHTPDALENILQAVRDNMPEGAALWCVFGCGGDRDASKRPTMGRIAERLADRAIVTSDNPRTEEPVSILTHIREGVQRPDAMRWIVDREEAIQAAADASAPGDVVVIAGKGHETTQTIGTDMRPFDDRRIARRYFSQ